MKTVESINALFSGTALVNGTKESSMREMKSGMASIASVTNHTSKKGAQSVKVVFDALAPNQEGHDEYLRTSSAENLRKSLAKIRYLFTHTDKPEALAAFSALPVPFTVPVGEDKQPIMFKTNEELDAIKAIHGENVDFLWASDDKESKERVCVIINDPKAYCDQVIEAIKLLEDSQYFLQVKAPNGDQRFQRLEAIKKPINLK